MSGDNKNTQNVVTRTDSEAKRKKAKEEREKSQGNKREDKMIISAQGEDITPREVFGKDLIPFSGYLKNIVITGEGIPPGTKLNVISKLSKHERRDTFEISEGVTEIDEHIKVELGTIIKFSLDFKGDSIDEFYISATLQTK